MRSLLLLAAVAGMMESTPTTAFAKPRSNPQPAGSTPAQTMSGKRWRRQNVIARLRSGRHSKEQTMTDEPTDEALENLFVEETGFATDDFPAAIFGFARAVLDKWGQPVVAGDVDRADAVNLARNALTQYDCAITKKGVRVLAEAVLSMDSALTTPQPAHAQPVAREPLTDEQIQDLLLCGNPTDEEMRLIRIGWDAANGIKGGQHGTE